MTTLVTETRPRPARSAHVSVRPVTFARVLHSEWVKMRSLRSTTLTLAAAIATIVAAGLIIGVVTTHYWSTLRPEEMAAFNPVDRSLVGYNLAQLAVGVLGVLLVSGEYATGMIRATLTAVPRRLPVLWAKATLYAVVTFVLMLAASAVAFLGGQALLGTHGTTLSSPGATRAVLAVAVYLTLIGVIAVALGFVLRSTAGGVATLFGLLMVVPGLGLLLPSSWHTVLVYLPSNAGVSMISTRLAPDALSPVTGLLVLLGWTAVALAAAAVLLRRRDA